MNISADKFASIHYTLTDSEGQVIDSSAGEEPMTYQHGHNSIVPGLENALEGKAAGDKFSIVVPPEEGYGEVDPAMIQVLGKDQFTGVDNVEVGMQFHAETQKGMQIVEVIGVDDETVTINANHPLAGLDLHFDIEVVEVREANEEESSCCDSNSGCCD